MSKIKLLFAKKKDDLQRLHAPVNSSQTDQCKLKEAVVDSSGANYSPGPFLKEADSASTSAANASLAASQPVSQEPGSKIEAKNGTFRNFDVVADFSDHHYKSKNPKGGFWGRKETPEWSKNIQSEWKLLQKELPESIFVRVYEERIDLMRAVIVGAAGTPYHDGLFFFDIHYPSNYPSQPPKVYFHSGGLRLNPNLYNSGRVCLSLLNTWQGKKCEMWNPKESNMLQVLLSIQALVLNEEPYFNEPWRMNPKGTVKGKEQSTLYSENIFILSCRIMIYTLNRPPKHFEDLVRTHFCERADAILSACKSYIGGAQVGFPSNMMVNKNTSFKKSVEEIFPRLLAALSGGGADCRKFMESTSGA